jgi:GT2 family glycosyltransferase
LALAAYDVVVFFDDDIEVEPGYLALLFQMMDSNPEAAGVGGVDILWRPARTWRRLYEYVICFRAIRRGRLSISGFGGDADRWIGEVEAFETQFLAGFNMAFRRDALRSLEMQDFFDGYSLGEDLYLSYVARQSGPLLVHPQLRVRHHQSALARDRSEQVFYTQLVNHYHLLRLMQSSRARCLSLVITGAGMFVRYAIKACVDAVIPSGRPDFGRMKGSWNGLKFVMTSVIRDSSRRAKA